MMVAAMAEIDDKSASGPSKRASTLARIEQQEDCRSLDAGVTLEKEMYSNRGSTNVIRSHHLSFTQYLDDATCST